MYGRRELASTTRQSSRSITSFIRESSNTGNIVTIDTQKDVQRMSNNVQAQIEQLFTDVAKDATSTFNVTCLGSLPLKKKVTSLQGLQEPLRDLYFKDYSNEQQVPGSLDICASGLRVKTYNKLNTNKLYNYSHNTELQNKKIIPFHNIAVWSAVKFEVSEADGSEAFLPLITDPENIDKTSLLQRLSPTEERHIRVNTHSPIFVIVMRSAELPKVLECHGFICHSTEDAIVLAATLYQHLMVHVNSNSEQRYKHLTPRNQNGVSCISIASSSAFTGSHYLTPANNDCRNSFCSANAASLTSRSKRNKRNSNVLQQTTNNVVSECTFNERKRVSHKTKRAPPIPTTYPGRNHGNISYLNKNNGNINTTHIHRKNSKYDRKNTGHNTHRGNDKMLLNSEPIGDILTRVAIPRSGSFLNTGGLTRYKSRGARRSSDKLGVGGGSPLGFSELFNEFRLQENLNSFDEILNAIINADGMSFNDLKPIYKEFLLKLAVALTKDELFQHSKHIMRRQKKKKSKKSISTGSLPKLSKPFIFGSKSLKKVFQLDHFRSCCGKPQKPPQNTTNDMKKKDIIGPIPITSKNTKYFHQHRSRVATSGSDVSVVRHDNTLLGLNRNSSSGYVSCSECSYDSDACTCVSADRCYCSLRTGRAHHKLLCKNETSKRVNKNCNGKLNCDSLKSCKPDEKCYCSMVDEENKLPDEANTTSDATWCDTDSCISASKCYCKHNKNCTKHKFNGELQKERNCSNQYGASYTSCSNTTNKFALDYDLFTIGGNGKSVQPHEALSMKKSVEAAAIFADVKLSQTTDIKSLCTELAPQFQSNMNNSNTNYHSVACTKKQFHSCKKRESLSGELKNKRNNAKSLSSSSSVKSSSVDNLLNKLNSIERYVTYAASIKSTTGRKNELLKHFGVKDNYQSMRDINTSLEDTLGYLP